MPAVPSAIRSPTRGVAQSGRAVALGATGRRFESCLPDFCFERAMRVRSESSPLATIHRGDRIRIQGGDGVAARSDASAVSRPGGTAEPPVRTGGRAPGRGPTGGRILSDSCFHRGDRIGIQGGDGVAALARTAASAFTASPTSDIRQPPAGPQCSSVPGIPKSSTPSLRASRSPLTKAPWTDWNCPSIVCSPANSTRSSSGSDRVVKSAAVAPTGM